MANVVRLIRNELFNFKNVEYGDVQYSNYHNANRRSIILNNDILGIYGQNGSGKTALIEALDIMKTILSGCEIDYSEYEGIISDKGDTKIDSVFFVEKDSLKYKVEYSFVLSKDINNRKIHIVSEKLTFWLRGASWKSEHNLSFSNNYNENSLFSESAQMELSPAKTTYDDIDFIKHIEKVAVYCASKNISVFFNEMVFESLKNIDISNDISRALATIILELFTFSRVYLNVVKVNQLGDINKNAIVPINIHTETSNAIVHGVLPMITDGHANMPQPIYNQLTTAIESINIALKSLIPDLSIEIVKTNEEINEENQKIIYVDFYSNRKGKRFLTKYESEGIKRIISLLNYLIAFYTSEKICLVVDELDSGIFEYLLGEILGALKDGAKGQLIFTSHNLRILEKLDNSNILCSTINPTNRYIKLQGIEKNNNPRDFYIRSVVVGGQKELLYDDTNLQSLGYAFRKAAMNKKDVVLEIPQEILNLLSKNE